MQTSPLRFQAYTCSKMVLKLKDCTTVFRGRGDGQFEEYKVILLRSGMNPDDFDDSLEICSTHRQLLCREFAAKINSSFCCYENHVGTRRDTATETISWDDSIASLRHNNLNIPLSMPICSPCLKNVKERLLEETIDSQTLSDTEVMETQSSEGYVPPSNPSEPNSQPIPDENEHKRKMTTFNDFLKACEEEEFPGREHFKNVGFKDSEDPSRRRKVLKGAARGIIAILKTATEVEEDRIHIWNHLKESGLVEELLGSEPQLSSNLADIILSYNNAANSDVRVQFLSAIVKSYKFCQLNRFNEVSEELEEEEEEEEEEDIELESDGLFWNPKLTRHMYNRAHDHYDKYKHGLEEVIREPRVYWKFDKEVVNAIITFVKNPDITQQVAYGTRLIDDPANGGKSIIAKVTRRFTNAELSRQIHAYLTEQNFPPPIPGLVTILRMLDHMPASKSKALAGLNPSHENNSRSFDNLSEILQEMKKKPQFWTLISQDDVDCLAKQINNSKVYIKNVFRYQVGRHSVVKSHCIQYACSSPKNENFSSILDCNGESEPMDTATGDMDDSGDENATIDHDGVCHHCEAVPQLFKILTGLLMQLRPHLRPTDFNTMLYHLQKAEFHIHAFKAFTMRSSVSRKQWNLFKKAGDVTYKAFCVVDFPMKQEGKKNKSKTTEWYGKVSRIQLIHIQ